MIYYFAIFALTSLVKGMHGPNHDSQARKELSKQHSLQVPFSVRRSLVDIGVDKNLVEEYFNSYVRSFEYLDIFRIKLSDSEFRQEVNKLYKTKKLSDDYLNGVIREAMKEEFQGVEKIQPKPGVRSVTTPPVGGVRKYQYLKEPFYPGFGAAVFDSENPDFEAVFALRVQISYEVSKCYTTRNDIEPLETLIKDYYAACTNHSNAVPFHSTELELRNALVEAEQKRKKGEHLLDAVFAIRDCAWEIIFSPNKRPNQQPRDLQKRGFCDTQSNHGMFSNVSGKDQEKLEKQHLLRKDPKKRSKKTRSRPKNGNGIDTSDICNIQ